MAVPLKLLTDRNMKAEGRSPLYSIKFDWQGDRFQAGIKNYDNWSQCYELNASGDYIGVNDFEGNATLNVDYSGDFGLANPFIATSGDNSGNGYISEEGQYALSYNLAGEGESFDIIAQENQSDAGECSFLIKCQNKDIGVLSDIQLSDPYGFSQITPNGYVKFDIQAGSSPFLIGDSFAIYPAITTRELSQTAIITNGNEIYTNFVVEGGPDFIYWDNVSWIGEGDVRVSLRTSNDLEDPRWSNWFSYVNGAELASELSRRYLQFKITLNSTAIKRAKIAKLSFNYSVKAHTNNVKSDYYEKYFNDATNIRVSRSKDYILAGYPAADCSITLDNSHRKYNLENSASPYFGKLQPNLRFLVEMGFDGQTVPKIEAFANSFSVDSGGRTFTIQGQDYVKQFLRKKIDDKDISSRVLVDKPVSFLVKMVALDVGFPLDQLNLEDTTITDTVPYAYFRKQEAWKALQSLLLGYEGEIYISESGQLVIRDRFKRKSVYRSPRFSTKNVIQSISSNTSNGDLLMIVNSEENDEPLLYLYNTDYTNVDSGVLSLIFCPEDQINGFSSTMGVKSNKIVRITGDSEIPSIEDIVQLEDYVLTNFLMYNPNELGTYKHLYGIVNTGSEYEFYKYQILNENNEILTELSNPQSQFLAFDINQEAPLTVAAKNIKNSSLTVINSSTSVETVLVYNVGWKFTDNNRDTVKLIEPYSGLNSYLLTYVSTNPITIIQDEIGGGVDIGIYFPDKLTNQMENNIDFFTKCIIPIASGYGYDGHVAIVNFNASDELYLTTTNGYTFYTYTDDSISKYYGGVCDSFSSKIYLFVLTSTGKKKILSFDLDTFSEIVDTGDEVLLDGVDDVLLNIYDVEYNEIDNYTYIACGYESDKDKDAYLLRYRQSHVSIAYENTVGKPLDKAVVREPNNISTVIDKDYNVFFQKRGGLNSTTSQIWSWFSYTRRNEDKIKSNIKETFVTLTPLAASIGVNGLCDTFYLSTSDIPLADIEYVYRSDANEGWVNIGDNFYKDTVNEYIVLTSPINTNTIQLRAGTGKIIKKYYGEYFKLNSTTTPVWNGLPFSSFPYKPTRLRFYGDNLVDGTIHVSGYDVGGNFLTEALSYTDTSGYVESEFTYDKNYNGSVTIHAEGVKNVDYTTITCESTYEDIIPGVDMFAHVNPDETEEQFGGNGLVSSFTNEAAVKVETKDGMEIVTKFPTEKAITAIDVASTGRVFGASSYIGRFFIYEKDKIIEDFYDFILRYDSNITKLDYSWSDSDVKNSITIKAKKKEASPFRESEIMTGILISDIPDISHIKDWSQLEILYKTEAPRFLSVGEYYEADINFQNPVLTHTDNVLRFNAHVSDFAGSLLSGDSGYYLDLNEADHSGNGFNQFWNDKVQFKLDQNFISLGPSGSYEDPYTGDNYWVNVAEAERRGMEVFVGNRKLYHTSGEFTAEIVDGDYVLDIPTISNHSAYVNAPLSIHYPMRWNIPQSTLERNIDVSGELSNDYLWSRVYDTEFAGIESVGTNDGKLKYYYVDKGGFQLQVLWPNQATYAETTYLRIENAATNSLDAYFDPEANPSTYNVWVDKLEIRGLPIIATPVTISTQRDLESIDKYFEQTYSLDNEYIQSVAVGERLAKYILKNSSKPLIKPNIQVLGQVNMQLGDTASLIDENSSLEGDIFEIIGITDNMAVGSVYSQDLQIKKVYDISLGKAKFGDATYDNGYNYS